MRYALAGFALLHAVAHLPGFLGSVEMPAAATRAGRLMWLALAIAFVALAVGVWLRSPWWLGLAVPAAILSSAACFTAWPAARFGLVANAMLLALAALTIRYSSGSLAVRNPTLEQLWTTAPGPAVRLAMRGEIKLGGAWRPFVAEQVIAPPRGMIWAATVSLYGLPVRGADQLLDGEGRMQWKLFDLIPVANAAGPDVTRSAEGRLRGETAAWLPQAADPEALAWRGPDGHFVFPRWGSPDGGPYRQAPFRVVVEEQRDFGGHRIPSRIQAGWEQDVFFRAVIERAEYK